MLKFFPTLLPVLLVGIMFAAGCQFSTAHFSEVTLSKSVDAKTKEPLERTTVYSRHNSTFHCSVKMANTPSDTKVKAVWWFDPSGSEKQLVDSTEILVSQDAWVDFTLANSTNGFPYGAYTVDLFINGKLEKQMPFSVKPMFDNDPIREIVTSHEVNANYLPIDVASRFRITSSVIYAPVYVQNALAGTTISAHWFFNQMGEDPRTIAKTDFPCEGSGWIGFSLKPNNTLQPGKYSVDILLNGESQHNVQFTME